MVRALLITGPSPAVVLTLVFSIIPSALGIWLLRIARSPSQKTVQDRFILVVIGGLGLVFWGGLIIGPVMAFIAAAVPDQI
jgi:hypothetical protein